jgi:hypothetical protein
MLEKTFYRERKNPEVCEHMVKMYKEKTAVNLGGMEDRVTAPGRSGSPVDPWQINPLDPWQMTKKDLTFF